MNTRSPGWTSDRWVIVFGKVSNMYDWFQGPTMKPNSFERSYITRRTRPQQSRKIFDSYSDARKSASLVARLSLQVLTSWFEILLGVRHTEILLRLLNEFWTQSTHAFGIGSSEFLLLGTCQALFKPKFILDEKEKSMRSLETFSQANSNYMGDTWTNDEYPVDTDVTSLSTGYPCMYK